MRLARTCSPYPNRSLKASITISWDLAPANSPLLRESQSQTLDVLNGTANRSARTG